MRYEAGPFAGIRFFRAVGEGLLVQSGRFLGLPGLLAQSGEGGGLPGRIIALAERRRGRNPRR